MHRMLSYIMCHLAGNRESRGIRHSKQLKIYKKLEKLQWNTVEENRKLQRQDLYKLIIHAINTVPYYKNLGFTEADFSIETIYEDMRKLPLLTKDIIRRQKDNMFSIENADWTYTSTSGGTTGEPVAFTHTGNFFDYDQAGKLLYDSWAGRRIGDPQISLWGSERDIVSGKNDWMNKIYRWCKNEEFLNTFSMTQDTMKEYIKRINVRKPKMILAYVQSAREIANFSLRNKEPIRYRGGVMTSAGTLDQDTYDLLKKVYGGPVLNRYGSREVSDMACSCDKNEGLHINMKTCYIEILDDEGNECKPGEKGNIIVTSLTEKFMPLIRYNIGDYGTKIEKACSCGRGWEMLGSVDGRIIDIFKTYDGRKIYGDYFTHLFYTENNIKQFQVIQCRIDHILVKLVPYDKVQMDFYDRMNYGIKKVMGETVKIDYEIVKDIPESASGKRAYTISLI